ncbi:MAG: DUF434 domain-containing protein [Deltaproteobacteria bacterium]|nr:DUF434 domain-containing protein [Deltaproteobacteria bacterium]MBW2068634.1 DUF434 domain-containing protein [Deltaproteobacteria bacterium]
MDKVKKPLIRYAAEDFFFLQTRGYPRERALEMVGNRYALTKDERDILRRGIYGQQSALSRRAKQGTASCWREKILEIDGHNVHITVESILLERTIVLANDGVLRDTAGLSRTFEPGDTAFYVVELIASFLREFTPEKVVLLFDSPMRKSGELARIYREALTKRQIPCDSHAVAVPEQHFNYASSIIASSDSAVMDMATCWVDLPRFVATYRDIKIKYLNFSDLIRNPIFP